MAIINFFTVLTVYKRPLNNGFLNWNGIITRMFIQIKNRELFIQLAVSIDLLAQLAFVLAAFLFVATSVVSPSFILSMFTIRY